MSAVRTFTDIDLSFTPHPLTGDVGSKSGENAIKQAVKNLVLTNNYERPFHPEIGCQVQNLLFEPSTPFTANNIEESIRTVIENFEPRVALLDVRVAFNDDNYSCTITIDFRIINTQRPIQIDLLLKRTR